MTSILRSAAGLLVVAGAVSAPIHAVAQGQVPAEVTAAPSATSSQIVVRDAASGQLRAATPEEAKTLRATEPQVRAARTLPRAHASGARGARLTDEFMSYSVLVRQPDGSFTEVCYASREEAEAATHAAPVAKSTPAPTE